MKLSPILGPGDRPLFSAGGAHAYKTVEYRGFVVSLEWAGSDTKALPCMVIWPAHNALQTSHEGNGMWCISRRAISEFLEYSADGKCTGDPSAYAFSECEQALEVMGKDRNDRQAVRALADLIVRFAGELVLMPLAPADVRREIAEGPMWDVTLKDKSSGRTLNERSV